LPSSAGYIEVRYEDFVAAPEKTLERIYEYVDLEVYPGLMERALGKVPILDFKSKYLQNLGKETVGRITGAMHPELARYGYD